MGFLKTKEQQILRNTCQSSTGKTVQTSLRTVVISTLWENTVYNLRGSGRGVLTFHCQPNPAKYLNCAIIVFFPNHVFPPPTWDASNVWQPPDQTAGLKDDQMSHELTDMLEVKKSLQDAFHPLFSIIWWSGKCLIVSEKGDQLWNQSNSSPSGGDGCANVFNWKCQIFFWYRSCLDADEEENKLLGRWLDRPSVRWEKKKEKSILRKNEP